MTLVRLVARWRVTLGFVVGALTLWLARPTWASLAVGASVAIVGESLRVWAAGHVEKSREVTQSGPYRWARHPLYLGSTIIGVGLSLASASLGAAILVLAYLGTTLPAAIRAEEAHLRDKFNEAYDAYAQRCAPPVARRFSLRRARGNREHHTIAGLTAGVGLMVLKIIWPR